MNFLADVSRTLTFLPFEASSKTKAQNKRLCVWGNVGKSARANNFLSKTHLRIQVMENWLESKLNLHTQQAFGQKIFKCGLTLNITLCTLKISSAKALTKIRIARKFSFPQMKLVRTKETLLLMRRFYWR